MICTSTLQHIQGQEITTLLIKSPTTVIYQDLTSLFFPSMILLWNNLSKGSNSYQVFKSIFNLIVIVLILLICLYIFFIFL